MRLFSQASLLVAALTSTITTTVTATDREAVLEHWKNAGQIIGRDIIIDDNGDSWVMEGVGSTLYKLVPRDEGSARRSRRRAQEFSATPSDGSYHHEETIEFSEQVDTSLSNPTFVFVSPADASTTLRVPADYIDGDIAVESVGGFTGVSYGVWTWYVEGTDADGSVVTTTEKTFEVGDEIVRQNVGSAQTIVEEAPWEKGGQVQGATGRIYFSSTDPSNGETYDYACTGTAIRDNKTGRSLILSAAHCIWDDVYRGFSHNAVFIPNRDAVDAEEGERVYRACQKDICGCWTLSAGFVHDRWTESTWPDNIPYDYGFYIVDDVGSHSGTSCRDTEALDIAVDELDFVVGSDVLGVGTFVHNYGYSLNYDPDFRYCTDTATTKRPRSTIEASYWMPSCLHSGGSSGGPWIQNMDESTGKGQIFTVNSWGRGSSGIGGPIIEGSAARCLVNAAREADLDALESQPNGEQGILVNCYDRPCIPEDEAARRKLRGHSRELCEHN